jgi:hypothetical protein
MGNVNMPTPVALAGGALCLLGGYLVGTLTGPDTETRTTATVESYDAASEELCLVGDAVSDLEGVGDGMLCGSWQPTGSSVPEEGDEFRFVSIVSEGDESSSTYIYGDVVE